MENKEFKYLQNFAEKLGVTVHLVIQHDKRRKTNQYFISLDNETISPKLTYNEMNHFMLGWAKALVYKQPKELFYIEKDENNCYILSDTNNKLAKIRFESYNELIQHCKKFNLILTNIESVN